MNLILEEYKKLSQNRNYEFLEEMVNKFKFF